MNCSHCGGRITDPGVTIHEACVGPALVERRRLRAEIAGRLLREAMVDCVNSARDPYAEAVADAERLLAALDAIPDKAVDPAG